MRIHRHGRTHFSDQPRERVCNFSASADVLYNTTHHVAFSTKFIVIEFRGFRSRPHQLYGRVKDLRSKMCV